MSGRKNTRDHAAGSTNTRIHIYFNHSGMSPSLFGGQAIVNVLLRAVLQEFGAVSDAFFHKEYSYAFVSYDSNAAAGRAIDALKVPARVNTAIAVVIGREPSQDAKALATRILGFIFQEINGSRAVTPSWAAPRHK